MLLEDDLRFVWPIAGLATTDRLGAARVDGEFKSEHRFADACFIIHAPILLDHHFYFTARSHVLLELRCIAGAMLEVDVGASGCDSSRDVTNRVAILGEDEEVFIDVLAIVQWHVVIGWLWAPDFGGDVDDAGRRGAGDEAMAVLKDWHQGLLNIAWYGRVSSVPGQGSG